MQSCKHNCYSILSSNSVSLGAWLTSSSHQCSSKRIPRNDAHISKHFMHKHNIVPTAAYVTDGSNSLHKPRRPHACFQRVVADHSGAACRCPPPTPTVSSSSPPPLLLLPLMPLYHQIVRVLNPTSNEVKKVSPWSNQRAPCVLSAAVYFRCVRDYCLCPDIRGERRTHRSLLSIFFFLCLRHKTAFCSPFFFFVYKG